MSANRISGAGGTVSVAISDAMVDLYAVFYGTRQPPSEAITESGCGTETP